MAKKTASDIAQSLGRGKEQRRSDTEWTTICPAHADNSPSLSVKEAPDGKILVKCHAGCDQTRIIDELRSLGLWEGMGIKNWKAIDVVPDGVAFPKDPVHNKLGRPKFRWEWKTKQGKTHGFTFRFQSIVDGKTVKEVLPMTYCHAVEDGSREWRWKSFNKPRPLYNLDIITKDKDKPVLIVEGEKTVDAAEKIFPSYIVTTWTGGSSAVKFVEWECLKNRDVVIWPDNDEPGFKAAAQISEILSSKEVEVKSVKTVFPPEDLPKGWDLADDVPDDIPYDVESAISTAVSFEPSGDAVMDNMNRQFAMTIMGDKAVIIWERWDPIHKRNLPNYVSQSAIRAHLANKFVASGRKEIPVFDYWLTHPMRKTYDGIMFEPREETPGFYNLWRDFSYEPDATGDWSMFDEHLRLNVAQGEEYLYKWIMAWFAQMVQFPKIKPGTSIAFRGLQGTGKTVIGHHFGQLFRDNYVMVDDERYVTGQFNSHMGHSLMLQAEEGFFAGDPRVTGRLKSLVTSETNRIEPKGKDTFEINNYMRLIITSNEGWIVPASLEERRFAVIDVGTGKMQNRSYFKSMNEQMKNGGYEGLLHHLLNLDISDIDVGVIPQTKALSDQKHHSLNPVAKFWFERLRDGEITQFKHDWMEHISTEELYHAFVERCKQWGVNRKPSDNIFGKELRELCGPDSLLRIKKTVEYTDKHGYDSKGRRWCYEVPKLQECRDNFDKIMGHPYDWSALETGIGYDDKSINDEDIPF